MKPALLLAISCTCFFSASSQQGIPDPTFGNGNGYVLYPTASVNLNTGYAVTVQPDGKILSAGIGTAISSGWDYFQVIRYLPDGTMDASFGVNGVVNVNPSEIATDGAFSPAMGIVVQPDGKIIIVGANRGTHNAAPYSFSTAIIRLLPDGSLDNSFSNNGKLNLQLSSGNSVESANDVALQADGKIVITGTATRSPVGNTMTIVRINTDGTLDQNFNTSGIVYVNFATPSSGLGVKIQPDGKIIAVGRVETGLPAGTDVALVRLMPDGSYDNAFDGDGKAVIDINNSENIGYDLDIQADGKIVVSGTTMNTSLDMLSMRLLSNGSPDPSFNNTGIKMIDMGWLEYGYATIVQPDGKILVGGKAETSVLPSSAKNAIVIKLNADGSTDQGFGYPPGFGLYSLGGAAWAEDIALQADGKIVAVGYGGNASANGRMALRLTNNVINQSPLPLNLVAFQVRLSSGVASISWTTLEERETDRFEVEHSFNGLEFLNIGQVKAAGYSETAKHYQFQHGQLRAGWNYYRLRMIDLDGTFSYSAVQRIHVQVGLQVQVSPNPAKDKIRIRHFNGAEIIIKDLQGRELIRMKAVGVETMMDISSWPKGIYMVVTIQDQMKSEARFVKD